jgi:hypothetical protein
VKAPVVGVDKVAHPENSGFPMRMWLRSWLRHAKVARVVVMGLRRLARTDFEGMRAGQFAHVGYPVMPMLVRMLAREVDATDS